MHVRVFRPQKPYPDFRKIRRIREIRILQDARFHPERSRGASSASAEFALCDTLSVYRVTCVPALTILSPPSYTHAMKARTPTGKRRKLTRKEIGAMKELIRRLRGSMKGSGAYEILMEERRRDLARGK